MIATATPVTERTVTVEMTESEARLLERFFGSGGDPAFNAFIAAAVWDYVEGTPKVREVRTVTDALWSVLKDALS